MENIEFRQTWGPGWLCLLPAVQAPATHPLQLVAFHRWASCWPTEGERGMLGALGESLEVEGSLCITHLSVWEACKAGAWPGGDAVAVIQAGLAL